MRRILFGLCSHQGCRSGPAGVKWLFLRRRASQGSVKLAWKGRGCRKEANALVAAGAEAMAERGYLGWRAMERGAAGDK